LNPKSNTLDTRHDRRWWPPDITTNVIGNAS
jgi:hypothetical protein